MQYVSEMSHEKLVLLIPIVACVGAFLTAIIGIVAMQWRKVRQTEMELGLKAQMLEQGRSIDEIERVFAAGHPSRKRCRHD